MPNIATINGIAEDNIATYNGGTSSLYTSKNGDTWVHNVAPTNPADNMVDFSESSSVNVTFAGATDDGSVVAYLVDNISNGSLTVSTAEVAAGSAHTFNSGAVGANTTVSFRVRAKDNLGVYSSGITMNTVIEDAFFAGSTYGYAHGANTVNIQRYSFSSNGNSVNVANLYTSQNGGAGTQSQTHSFQSGSTTNGISKHQFNTGNTGTSVGNLSSSNKQPWAGSSSSPTHGYHFGGGDPTITNIINRWAFASNGNAANTGTISNSPQFICGGADWGNSYAYWAGGSGGTAVGRFAYGSSSSASAVGNLPHGVDPNHGTGPCSTTHGYTWGGYYALTSIQKYSFASTTSTSNIGTCTSGWAISCSTSTTKGYGAGGSGRNSTIDSVTLSSGGTSTAVGSLATAMLYPSGSHV